MRGCAFLFFEYGSHLFCGIGCLKSKIRKAGLKLMVSCIGFELFVYCTFELKCSSEKICHLRHMLMLLFGIVALPFPCLISLTSLPTAISCYQLSPTQKIPCIKLYNQAIYAACVCLDCFWPTVFTAERETFPPKMRFHVVSRAKCRETLGCEVCTYRCGRDKLRSRFVWNRYQGTYYDYLTPVVILGHPSKMTLIQVYHSSHFFSPKAPAHIIVIPLYGFWAFVRMQ